MRSSLEGRIDHYDTVWEDICYEMFLCLTLFFIISVGKACSLGGVSVQTIWCVLHLASHYAAAAAAATRTSPPTPSTYYLLYIPYTHKASLLSMATRHHYQPCKLFVVVSRPPLEAVWFVIPLFRFVYLFICITQCNAASKPTTRHTYILFACLFVVDERSPSLATAAQPAYYYY